MKLPSSRALIVACICAFGLSGPARSETLADALVSAYKNSNLIEQNRAVLRAADEDVASAVAALRPVLEWVASTSLVDTPQFQGISSSLAIQGRVLLTDFGRSNINIDIAEQAVLATRQALVNVEQDVLLAAVSSYFGVRSAMENVAINQNSVRVLDETLRATQDQFDVGEVTRTDVAQAEARLAAARASLAAAEGQLAAAREAYKATTGNYPGALAIAPTPPALPRALDDARSIAQRSHPAIRQAQHQAAGADLGVAFAAAQRLPVVNGTAGIDLNEKSANTTAIGIEMRQTIFSGGALSAVHRKAIANRDAARSALLQTSVIVTQNVGSSWADIEVARAQITATERQIAAATIAYDGVREEAKLGARTTLDVLDAEQALLDARSNRITAEANLQVAIYSLLSSMGLLTAEYLNLGVPIYDPEAYYNAVKSAPATSVQGESLDRVLKAIGKN
ncbi:TolC family outer membrane protein [Defluviimonas aestuarii]|uniref:TolC family outer membrane protein n=1 Tax=Albidovulum aestuarii TaxID=1130726 RepID=UPI00249CC334|nr:TolC family outer membrane protein [Defluviimonas aestuarii]MDI3338059.1 TolC family outer membrane protein [Defluviimonas aestuarii]